MMERTDAILPWVARAAWIATVVGGGAIDDAVAGRSAGVRWVAGVGSWTLFGVVLVALLVPSVRSLTATRVLAPIGIVIVVAAAFGGADGGDLALLAGPVLVAVAAIASPEVGRWMVQASAYGDEQRFPLRVPAGVGLAAVVAWVIWAPLVVVALLALGSADWVVGVPLGVVAIAASWLLLPRWHRISRRWFVLVPAGVVLHDPVVLADTLMIPLQRVSGLVLAPADTTAADLTGPAGGHLVEVTTADEVRTVLAATPREPGGRPLATAAFLVAPSRPGRLLTSARARGLPVG